MDKRNNTNRKQNIDALGESEERFELLFNNAPLGYQSLDIDGNFIDVNQQWLDTLGYSKTEVIGKWFGDFLSPMYQDGFRTRFPIFKAKGRIHSEFEMIHKNGNNLFIAFEGRIGYDTNGDFKQTHCILQDITESKLAAEALKESEIKFHSLFNEMLEGFALHEIICDNSGFPIDYRFLEMNPAFEHLTGLNAKEVLGKSILEVLPAVEKYWIETFGKVALTGIPEVFENFSKELNKYYRVSAFSNKKNQFVTVFEDITDRKQTEQKLIRSEHELKKAQQITHIGSWYLDVATNEVKWTEELYKMYGFDPNLPVPSYTEHMKLFTPESWEILSSALAKTAETGVPYELELQTVRKDKSNGWMWVRGEAQTDSEGNIFGLWGAAQDISERKEREEQLKNALDRATEADRLKTAFLANMSHEIRTPMNGILGFAELLKEPQLTFKEQQDFIQTMQISGARMLNTINNIVDVSKLESGMMKVNIDETDLNEKLEFTYKFFKPEVENKGLKFSFKNGLQSNEAIIKTDNEKVYGILTNLIKNAIKFTYEGSIEFGYDLVKIKDSASLKFFVTDTGVGIPDNHKELIFERFRQGSDSFNRNYEGSGLGLSISKSYVEMLGGRIWVESHEGKGTTFYFTIPYNPVSEEITSINNGVSEEQKDVQTKKLKILIVEDDEISYSLLKRVIHNISKDVTHALTGIEAVEACRNNSDFDLVLMDIRMPQMNGLEATQQIRKFNKDVIIIAQTAYGFSCDCEKALEAGCNDYITKPINKTLLFDLINKHCSK